jgi:DNA-binding GntR family transcriptional regulator
MALEIMTADDRGAIVERIIKQARNGCRASQRLIVDRLEPPRKGRAAPFPLPPIKTAADVVNALAAVTAALAAGTISPDEALQLANVVELMRRAIETEEHEIRLRELEKRFEP